MTGFTASSFYATAITYTLFVVFCWLAPSALAVLGPKVTMLLGACAYPLAVASFFHMTDWLYYSSSALVGLGAALLWPAKVSRPRSELH